MVADRLESDEESTTSASVDLSRRDGWPETGTLVERIEALEKGLAVSSRDDAGAAGDEGSFRHRDAEIAQLRLKSASLASQLANANKQLSEIQGTRLRRGSRRPHHRPTWRFWLRWTRR